MQLLNLPDMIVTKESLKGEDCPMFTIKSSRLSVSIAEPNVENNTARFNRNGFITSAILDNRHEFCGDERGGTWGAGLCCEITTRVMYEDIRIGEQFPKFGVGILTKYEDAPYDSLKHYEVEPFSFHACLAADNKLVIDTDPCPFHGYALKEKKTYTVHENILRVDYEVENVGEKELEYAEYCHNFLTTEFDGKRNNYNLYMQAGDAEYPYKWRIHYTQSGLYINVREYFSPDHFNIWSPGFVISPEVYFKKVLKSGDKAVYSREWEFNDD